MQSETGFPSSHQLKSYVASKSRLKLAARAVLSADAGLLVAQLTAECPYTVQWAAPFPLKTAPFQGCLDPRYCSWGPPELTTQTISRSVQPLFFAELTTVTDRPSD